VRGRLAYVGIATAFSLVALGSSAEATGVYGSAPAASTGVLAVAVHAHRTPAWYQASAVEQTVYHPYVTATCVPVEYQAPTYETVIITSEVPASTKTIEHHAVPAVTHVVHHDAVYTTVHHDAIPAVIERVHYVRTGGPVGGPPPVDSQKWNSDNGKHNGKPHQQPDGVPYQVGKGQSDWFLWMTNVVTDGVPAWDKQVLLTAAWDETIIDTREVRAWTEYVEHTAIPAVTEQHMTDSGHAAKECRVQPETPTSTPTSTSTSTPTPTPNVFVLSEFSVRPAASNQAVAVATGRESHETRGATDSPAPWIAGLALALLLGAAGASRAWSRLHDQP